MAAIMTPITARMLAALMAEIPSSMAIIDACKPFERKDNFAEVIGVSPELASQFRENGSWRLREPSITMLDLA